VSSTATSSTFQAIKPPRVLPRPRDRRVLPNRHGEGGRLRLSCLCSGPQMRSAAHCLTGPPPRFSIARSGGSTWPSGWSALGSRAQGPSLYTLLLDLHGEAAFWPLVVGRQELDGPIRAQVASTSTRGLSRRSPRSPTVRSFRTGGPQWHQGLRGVRARRWLSDRSGRRTGRPFTHVECGMPKA